MTHLCRRICLLRERGDFAAAQQIEQEELVSALAACRLTLPDPQISQRLLAIFAAESDRVATAAVLAEFLLPAAPVPLAASLPSLAPFEPAPPVAPTAARAPAAAAQSAGNQIAGFIDQMLAMPEDDAPPPRRRAS